MNNADAVRVKVEQNINGEYMLCADVLDENGQGIRYLTKFVSRDELLSGEAFICVRIEGMPINGDRGRIK